MPATRSYNEIALARDNTDHSLGRYYWDGDETAVNVEVIGVLYIYICWYYVIQNYM